MIVLADLRWSHAPRNARSPGPTRRETVRVEIAMFSSRPISRVRAGSWFPVPLLAPVLFHSSIAWATPANPLFATPFRLFVTGVFPTSVAVTDLNADGRPDVVTANECDNSISVLLGSGDGTFGTRMDRPTDLNPVAVALLDLDGDGRPDLVVADNASNAVTVLLNIGTEAVSAIPTGQPQAGRLLSAWPNPVRSRVTIGFDIATPSRVTAEILDSSGRLLRVLVPDGKYDAGRHSIVWDGADGSGRRVTDGIYFVHLRADGRRGEQKLLVLN